ncbi:MAG: hypothetical protein HOV96_40670 [Nonomuraea sp.]|nr:hypothetical protein [Nonomuraea sp.]
MEPTSQSATHAAVQPAVGQPKRSLASRWQLWLAIVVVLVAVAVGVGLWRTSDSVKTQDLRDWLANVHKFDPQYEDLGTATYVDGNVVVEASHVWADPSYGSYFLCAWVEPWLRDLGNGDENSQIIVRMGGQETLRSRGPQESCIDASTRA